MSDDKGFTIGKGSAPNYIALLLFLTGGILSGVAVYQNLRRASYIIPLALALLCGLIASAIIARKGSDR